MIWSSEKLSKLWMNNERFTRGLRFLWVDTDNRHIISMKSQGFSQTPQDIIEEYNGCSVPQYTAYPSNTHQYRGGPCDFLCYLLPRSIPIHEMPVTGFLGGIQLIDDDNVALVLQSVLATYWLVSYD